MLGCVWQELAYRIDVCRVTNGAHIEHLRTFHVKIEITSFLNLPDGFYIFNSFRDFIVKMCPRLLKHPVYYLYSLLKQILYWQGFPICV